MKRKILSMALALMLAASTLPLGVLAAKPSTVTKSSTASNPSTAGKGAAQAAAKAAQKVQSNAYREQIRSINQQIMQLRQQARADVAQIKKDLAGTASMTDITGSQDYKDVVAALATAKSELASIAKIDYKTPLKGLKGTQSGADAAFQSVINLMTDRQNQLSALVNTLDATKQKADAIAAQRKNQIAAWQSFRQQAQQLKQTIDTGHGQIASLDDQDKSLLNQIVTTISANQDVLASKPQQLTSITAGLASVASQLKDEYDGKIAKATAAYGTYRKSGDYTNALAQLQSIISMQSNRITVLQKVESELNDILGTLNSLVGSQSSAPSAPQTTSSSTGA